MAFETHLREVVSKAVRNLGVVPRAGNLFDCPRVFKGCFNKYDLTSLEYCASVWMSSAKSHVGLLDYIFRSAERLCQGELCCLEHRKKIRASCLLNEFYYILGHPMNDYIILIIKYSSS